MLNVNKDEMRSQQNSNKKQKQENDWNRGFYVKISYLEYTVLALEKIDSADANINTEKF